MSALRLDQAVRRDPRVAWRAFESEVAIIAPWASSVHTLTEVGARFWELADGRTLGDIMDVLLGEFDVTREVLETDIAEFVEELGRRQLLERDEP